MRKVLILECTFCIKVVYFYFIEVLYSYEHDWTGVSKLHYLLYLYSCSYNCMAFHEIKVEFYNVIIYILCTKINLSPTM